MTASNKIVNLYASINSPDNHSCGPYNRHEQNCLWIRLSRYDGQNDRSAVLCDGTLFLARNWVISMDCTYMFL